MTGYRTVGLTRTSKMLHVEAPGCIINISPYLNDKDGRPVVHVSIAADGDRYKGDDQWWVDGEAGSVGFAIRVIQTSTPAPPAAPPELVALLLPYISSDDALLAKGDFLLNVRDRITDDLAAMLAGPPDEAPAGG